MYVSALHPLPNPVNILMPPLTIMSNHSHGTLLASSTFLSSWLANSTANSSCDLTINQLNVEYEGWVHWNNDLLLTHKFNTGAVMLAMLKTLKMDSMKADLQGHMDAYLSKSPGPRRYQPMVRTHTLFGQPLGSVWQHNNVLTTGL
jgi:hypothetical protein